MSAVQTPRYTVTATETEGNSLAPYFHRLSHNVSSINDQRTRGTHDTEAATVKLNQEPRATMAAKEPSLNPFVIKGHAKAANIRHHEWIQRRKMREMNKALERVHHATRILQQVTASGPTGGYSPLAKRLLQRKAQRSGMPPPPKPAKTINSRQPYMNSRWTQGSRNATSLGQQRTELDRTKREFADLTKCPDAAAFTRRTPLPSFPGAGTPTSYMRSTAPVQKKRKRCIEDYPTQGEFYSAHHEIYSAYHEVYSAHHEVHSTQNDICSTQNNTYSTQSEVYPSQGDIYWTQGDIYPTQHEVYSTQHGICPTQGEVYWMQDQPLGKRR